MARIAAFLFLVLAASQAFGAEPWNLIWVSRSSDWFVKRGQGQLVQHGNELRGILGGHDGTSRYAIRVKFKGSLATATFEVIPSDASPAKLTGTYERVVSAGPQGCWETIWLDGGYDHVGLARNTACKP